MRRQGVARGDDLALALALAWPGERLLLEADPTGGDLAFRLRGTDGGLGLDPEPSVLSLAVDARTGLEAGSFPSYAQTTCAGRAVIPGAPTAEDHQPMRELWARVAAEAAAWDGVVLAELGRLHPGHPGLPLLHAAAVVVIAGSDHSVEGLYRLRHRVAELEHLRSHHPGAAVPRAGTHDVGVAVAVIETRVRNRVAIEQATRVLRSAGSAAFVAGWLASDPSGVSTLYAGRPERRLARCALVTSARALAQALIARWPDLAAAPSSTEGVVV